MSQDPDGPFGGAYGGPNRSDIYSDSEQFGLYSQQGQQAADFAYFFLKRMSEGLPPQTEQLAIAGDNAGDPPIINTSIGSIIEFSVTENRSADVNVDLFVKETGDRLIGSGAVLSLVDAGNPAGEIQTRNLQGAQTWDGADANKVTLFRTDPNNLNLLPFKATFQITWKGQLKSGSVLEDGTYTLCLNVKDADGNNSSQTQDLCDKSAKFRFRRGPVVTVHDPLGFQLFSEASGVQSAVPSALLSQNLGSMIPVTVDDALGLNSVSVQDPNGNPVSLQVTSPVNASAASLSNVTHAEIRFIAVERGSYTLDAIGGTGTTSARFTLATIAAELASGSVATYSS